MAGDDVDGGDGDDVLYGNLEEDRLIGDAGANTLFGGQGNDEILGGNGGADRCAFADGSGADTVTDFFVNEDLLQIATNINRSGISSFDAIVEALSDDASGNAVIDLGSGHSVTLIGVRSSDLIEADFLFV